jgi:hypothetical protein
MISQIDLICAIVKHLERQGIKTLVPRQNNAIIDAANNIIAACEQYPVMASEGMGLQAWLASDDVGASSRYLASVLGDFVCTYAHPYDLDDFGRCSRLLVAVPEFRDRIEEMRDKSRQWAALLDLWLDIEALMKAEKYQEANKIVMDAVSSR